MMLLPIHRRVARFIAQKGPLTDGDLAEHFEMKRDTMRRIRGELVQLGRIEVTGVRRSATSRRNSKLWRIASEV